MLPFGHRVFGVVQVEGEWMCHSSLWRSWQRAAVIRLSAWTDLPVGEGEQGGHAGPPLRLLEFEQKGRVHGSTPGITRIWVKRADAVRPYK